jgi:hypothetical protein
MERVSTGILRHVPGEKQGHEGVKGDTWFFGGGFKEIARK